MKFTSLSRHKYAFKLFLAEWPVIKGQSLIVQQKRAESINKIKSELKDESVIKALTAADKEFGDVIRNAGYQFDQQTADLVSKQALQMNKTMFLEKSVVSPKMRQAVSAFLNLPPSNVTIDTLWTLLSNIKTVVWYKNKLTELGMETEYKLTVEELTSLAQAKAKEQMLQKVDRLVGGDIGGGFMGIGERMTWLLVLSMIVCIVGIANAMLMSVTERFREIAVLKCLGALDGFIMLMFVIESSILGIFGGIVGSIMGTIIGLGRMLARLGSLIWSGIPVGQLILFMIISTLLGIILAGVASIYPSIKAARLAPMEAMRIE
jgi:putative ABC transport system permease protein